MDRVLVDTDTLSEVMKGHAPAIHEAATRYLAEFGRFTFSIITRYEILRGLRSRGATAQALRFEIQCANSEVLALTDDVVDLAATIYADLYRRGQLITDADILIAATAMVHGCALVTGNVAHHQRINGLSIDTWHRP